MGLAEPGLDLASKLRSHFLANLPAQSYAWLNGIQAHTSPALAPAYRPGPPWLPAPPALEAAGKLGGDKHPLGGIRTSAVKRSIGSTTGCTITEKAPTRAFSWLKAPTSAFTFKTLLRHYAKRALTPRSLNVKLGPRHKSQKGRAGWLA